MASDEIAPGIVAQHGRPYLKRTDVGVIKILRELAAGATYKDLSSKFGVKPRSISDAFAYVIDVMSDEDEMNRTAAWRSGEPLELAPGIVADKNIRFGRPTIKGTRMDVMTVLGELGNGSDIHEFAEAWSYSPAQVSDVLNYAANVVEKETVIPATR